MQVYLYASKNVTLPKYGDIGLGLGVSVEAHFLNLLPT